MEQNKIFYSAEIRWISETREDLYVIYKSQPGESEHDSKRTDYYLKVASENTGIKTCEGKHE